MQSGAKAPATTPSAFNLARILLLLAIMATASYNLGSVFCGWPLPFDDSLVPMAPLTAGCFIALGGGLLLRARRPIIAEALLLLATGAPTAILLQYLVNAGAGTHLDAESLLAPVGHTSGGLPTGRISPVTALLFLAQGAAALLLPFRRRPAEIVVAASLAATTILLIGYLYGVPLLYGGSFIPVAASTAAAFFGLGLALLTDGYDGVVWRIYRSPRLQVRLSRVLIPSLLGVIVLNGWVDARFIQNLGPSITLLSSTAAVLVMAALVSVITVLASRRVEGRLSRAITSLRQSEERHRLLFETMSQGVVYQDHNGFITAANPAACRILGRDLDALMGVTSCDEDWQALRADGSPFPGSEHPAMAALRGGKPVEDVRMGVYNPLHAEYVWIDVSATPQFQPGEARPVRVFTTFTDVTRRVRAEQALARSEEQYRLLFETLRDGFALHEIILDEKGAPQDYRFLLVNPAFERLTGLRAPDLIGRCVLEVLPGTEKIWIERYGGVALTGEPIEFEDYFPGLGRHYRVRAFRPGPNQFAVLFSDVTDEINNLEEIRRSRAELDLRNRIAEAFLTTADDHIYETVLTILQERFASALGLFGYLDDNGDLVAPGITPGIMVRDGVPAVRTVFPADTWGSSVWARALREGRTIVENQPPQLPAGHHPVENFIVCPILFNEVSIGVVVLGNAPDGYSPENIRLLAAACRSIAPIMDARMQRKRAEDAQSRLQTQLVQSQKLESVGMLAGGVAHDFNNLLTGISGNIALAAMETPPDDPRSEHLVEAARAAQSAAELVGQLLAFSRKQIVEPRVLDVNEVIGRSIKLIRRLIGEDLDMLTVLASVSLRVRIDPAQLEQILVNLAVNARDAMPDGGKLTIETAAADLDEEYCRTHAEVTPGRYVMLAVTDTGKGIPREHLDKIFDPFFTTKIKGKGTGLGLATVYGVVKQNQGSISVYSEPGEGAAFKVYLPQVNDPSVAPTAPPPPLNELPRGKETVLLVEDEPIVRNLAGAILSRLGYTVLSCASGAEALAREADFPSDIHLLMTDVVMPQMNGKILSERIRKRRAGIKVLFTSGYTENVIAHHGVLDEGIHFIGKPYTPAGLAVKIRDVLASG